jgi:acetyltransferase-like isoleucine patch superfamily enzyme
LKLGPASTAIDGARNVWERIARAASDEVSLLYPGAVLAEAVSRALPPQTFGYTRTMILRAAGFRIGPGSRIQGPIHLTGRNERVELLTIGADCVVMGSLHVDLGATVQIGNRVHIGHNVTLLTVNHDIGPADERCGGHRCSPIIVEDGAWLGSRVTILAGIAAGAVVTRDVMPNTMVAGVPAKMVQDLEL